MSPVFLDVFPTDVAVKKSIAGVRSCDELLNQIIGVGIRRGHRKTIWMLPRTGCVARVASAHGFPAGPGPEFLSLDPHLDGRNVGIETPLT
jgi:hypothetical protein